MDIGAPQRVIYVEPIELPEPLRTEPREEPVSEPVQEPKEEPVGYGER